MKGPTTYTTYTAMTPYGELKVYGNDHIGQVLLSGFCYEQGPISILLANFTDQEKAGGVAVDVGANYGVHALAYASQFKKVIAFEPQEHLFDLLRENTAKRPVQCENVALGHTCMPVFINNTVEDAAPDVNYGSRKIKLAGENPVEMRTLDSYNLENVALIKIDVEGAENLVFWGAQETIKRCRPVLFFEYDKVSRFADEFHIYKEEIRYFNAIEFLLRLKYTRIETISKNFMAIPKKIVQIPVRLPDEKQEEE